MGDDTKATNDGEAEQPRKDNRWRLSSPAADDVRWFYRCAGAALGLSASRFEMPAETIRRQVQHECRRCHMQSPGRPGSKCAHCGAMLLDFERIETNPSRGGSSPSTTSKPDHVVDAVAKERRIRTALARVEPSVRALLERAYTARQYTPEIRRVLGEFADVAMRLPRCVNAYERYLSAWHRKRPPERLDSELWPEVHTPPLAARTARRSGLDVKEPDPEQPMELEDWLTRVCREKGKERSLLAMKEEAERAICDALAEYQAFRIPASGKERMRDALQAMADKFTGGKIPSGRRKRKDSDPSKARPWNEVHNGRP